MTPKSLKMLSTPEAPPLSVGERDVQRLWSAVSRRDWSSLVLVPVGPGGSAKAYAQGMGGMGPLFRERVRVFDGEGADLTTGPQLAGELKAHVAGGGIALAAVDPVVSSLAGIPLVLAADAAVLLLRLGEADLGDARSTVEIVGRDRILGCVVVG
jgi:hypothetical protein